MRDRLPHARLVTFPGYGHGVNLLAPDAWVEEIRAFIRA
jgi:pimeloyl-ACP methyl ester carboxylesterase